jgi:hypothetical protein
MQHSSPQNWHGLLVHRSTCNTQCGAGFESGVQYQVVGDDSDDVQGKCITYARECVTKFRLALIGKEFSSPTSGWLFSHFMRVFGHLGKASNCNVGASFSIWGRMINLSAADALRCWEHFEGNEQARLTRLCFRQTGLESLLHCMSGTDQLNSRRARVPARFDLR